MIYRIIALVTAVHVCAALVAARVARVVLPHPPGTAVWVWGFLFLDAFLLVAMLERRAPFFGRIAWRGRADVPAVALSFDDGPNEPCSSQVLDILRRYDVKATFFAIGANAERHPETLRRLVAEGHELGNHTYDHAVLPLRGPRHIRETVRRTSDLLERITGVRPQLFRAPHGWRNPWSDRAVRAEGCEPVAWSLGVFDTARPGADAIRDRTLRGLHNGCIVLLHDGRGLEPAIDGSQLVEALPGIIEGARARGFRVATVGELLAKDGRA
jgi:peptidoglycan-N-acetylglucosamine deacetylase